MISVSSICNGKLKFRVTAKVGDKPLHMHAFDIANDTSRRKFLSDLETKARDQGVDVDLPKLEAEMLQLAQDAALGLAEDDSSAADREVAIIQKFSPHLVITVLGETR